MASAVLRFVLVWFRWCDDWRFLDGRFRFVWPLARRCRSREAKVSVVRELEGICVSCIYRIFKIPSRCPCRSARSGVRPIGGVLGVLRGVLFETCLYLATVEDT